jgi:hypothetical protein
VILKAYAITTAILISAIAFLFWQNNIKAEELGKVQAEMIAANKSSQESIQRLSAQMKSSQKINRDLEDQLQELDLIILNNKKNLKEISKRNDLLQAKLRSIKSENKEIQDLLSTPIPDDISSLFFRPDSEGNRNSRENNHQEPTNITDDQNRSANFIERIKSGTINKSLSGARISYSIMQSGQVRSDGLENESRKLNHLADVKKVGSNVESPIQQSFSESLFRTVSLKSARQNKTIKICLLNAEKRPKSNSLNNKDLSCSMV